MLLFKLHIYLGLNFFTLRQSNYSYDKAIEVLFRGIKDLYVTIPSYCLTLNAAKKLYKQSRKKLKYMNMIESLCNIFCMIIFLIYINEENFIKLVR